jgi:hypothetical protein
VTAERPLVEIRWFRVVALGACLLALMAAAAVGLGVRPGADDTIAGCVAPADAYGRDPVDHAAPGARPPGEAGARDATFHWLERQGRVDYLITAVQRSSLARTYMDVQLDERHEIVLGVRSHDHDDAIRDCARRLKLLPLHLRQIRSTSAEVARAIARVERSARDLSGIFTAGQEDIGQFVIDVYRGATAEQRTQLRRAAQATGVDFTIRNVDTEKPLVVPVADAATTR